MGAIRLKATMEAMAAALVEASVVEKAWPFPFEAAAPGDAVIGYPEIVHDMTFGRGADTATFPIWIIAGVSGEASTVATIERLAGDGAGSVKAALETGEHGGLGQVISSLRVTRTEPESVMLGRVRYVALRHECEVIS